MRILISTKEKNFDKNLKTKSYSGEKKIIQNFGFINCGIKIFIGLVYVGFVSAFDKIKLMISDLQKKPTTFKTYQILKTFWFCKEEVRLYWQINQKLN